MTVTSGFDTYVVYRIIKILSTPWIDMDAYKLGIIDKNGKLLKNSYQLRSREEQNAYTLLHRFVFNLKRLLEYVPGGRSKIASYAAALALLRESDETSEADFLFEEFTEEFEQFNRLFESELKEDGESFAAPTNNAGDGHIAAIGVGTDGEPPNRKKRRLSKFADYVKET